MPMKKGHVRKSLTERMAEKTKIDKNGCHIWTGFIDKAGYGRIREGGRGTPVLYVHRAIYELEIGPIPDGLVLDHLCRVRHCRNPEHLEAVTNRTNCLRGDAPTAILWREGVCKNGHPDTPENSYRVPKTGRRQCRVCRRERRAAQADAGRST